MTVRRKTEENASPEAIEEKNNIKLRPKLTRRFRKEDII